jgi:hypothetical protein
MVTNLPKGTWMVKMKIENNELWDKVKAGELKGLSIEGYFTDKMAKMSEKLQLMKRYYQL